MTLLVLVLNLVGMWLSLSAVLGALLMLIEHSEGQHHTVRCYITRGARAGFGVLILLAGTTTLIDTLGGAVTATAWVLLLAALAYRGVLRRTRQPATGWTEDQLPENRR